ncbi:MAG: nuclear transport factor 2 family protein [Anaerolineales bacterium]|nr:nuclear transport factor 2 family protein [Anaerolineales bacterium]
MIDGKKLVMDVMAALADGDDRPFLDAMHNDMKWTWMGSGGLSRTFDGKESVLHELWKSVKTDIAQPFRVTATLILAEGDHVVVEGVGNNKTPNGKEYNNRYCWVMKISGGKIVELKEYMDTDLVRRTFSSE